ncbi:MAG: hypothetical protein WKF91_15715, partial [Segetibacter sp.]
VIVFPDGRTRYNDVTVKSGVDIQFYGDSRDSEIDANIYFQGVAKPTFLNVHVIGKVTADDANQDGGSINLNQTNITGGGDSLATFKDLTHTRVVLQNGNIAYAKNEGLVVDNSKVVILSGSESNSKNNHVLRNKGILVMDASWYESNNAGIVFVVEDGSRLTIINCNIDVREKDGQGVGIGLLAKNFYGRITTILGGFPVSVFEGDASKGKILMLGSGSSDWELMKLGQSTAKSYSKFKWISGGGSAPVSPNSQMDANFIFAMLTDALSINSDMAEYRATGENQIDFRAIRASFTGGLTFTGKPMDKQPVADLIPYGDASMFEPHVTPQPTPINPPQPTPTPTPVTDNALIEAKVTIKKLEEEKKQLQAELDKINSEFEGLAKLSKKDLMKLVYKLGG